MSRAILFVHHASVTHSHSECLLTVQSWEPGVKRHRCGSSVHPLSSQVHKPTYSAAHKGLWEERVEDIFDWSNWRWPVDDEPWLSQTTVGVWPHQWPFLVFWPYILTPPWWQVTSNVTTRVYGLVKRPNEAISKMKTWDFQISGSYVLRTAFSNCANHRNKLLACNCLWESCCVRRYSFLSTWTRMACGCWLQSKYLFFSMEDVSF